MIYFFSRLVRNHKLIKVFWAKNKLKLFTMQALCMKCSMYDSNKLVLLRNILSLLNIFVQSQILGSSGKGRLGKVIERSSRIKLINEDPR